MDVFTYHLFYTVRYKTNQEFQQNLKICFQANNWQIVRFIVKCAGVVKLQPQRGMEMLYMEI